MFFIHKVKGFSMEPDIKNGSFLISQSFTFSENKQQYLIFNHKYYGNLVKKLIKVDNDNNHWFQGANESSINENQIGPVKKEDIKGQVLVSIYKRNFKFFFSPFSV